LELECNSEEAMKEAQRKAMQDLVRRLSSALGTDYSETMLSSPDGLIHKASDLVQVRFSANQNQVSFKMSLNVSDMLISQYKQLPLK
jgi:hypothetical protein